MSMVRHPRNPQFNNLYQQDREAQREYITHCYLGTTEEQKAIAKQRLARKDSGRYGSSGIRMTKTHKRRITEANKAIVSPM